MKVHLIRKKTIREFVAKTPRGTSSFDDWLLKVGFADWKIPEDIKRTFTSADLLGKGSSRVVFDLAGNKFRMICK